MRLIFCGESTDNNNSKTAENNTVPYLAADAALASSQQPASSADHFTSSRIRRCMRLARAGELSRAVRALAVSPSAPPTEATLSTLISLHPSLPRPLPEWVAEFTPTTSFSLTEEALHGALATAPREAASGPSGWLFEHVRDIFLAGGALFQSFFSICSTIAAGSISPTVAALLGTSRLEAFTKDPAGVRPIAIGEVFYRLIGRAVFRQLRSTFAEHLAPYQLAVGVSGGTEVVTRGLEVALQVHPDWALLQVDIRNAFNSVNRETIFEELQASPLSAIFPFVRAFYALSGRLLYCPIDGGLSIISSANGTRQGDPLAGPLFALALGASPTPDGQRQFCTGALCIC